MKGYETFFETVKSQIGNKLDVIVSVIHFMLVNEFDYLCVGIGEEFPKDDTNKNGTELLPQGWNKQPNLYALRYRSSHKDDKDSKLILKCIVVGDLFIATALPLNSSNTVHSVSLQPNLYITDNWNESFSKAFVSGSLATLSEVLKKEMFYKLRPEQPKKHMDSDNSTKTEKSSPYLLEPINHPMRSGIPPPNPFFGTNPYADFSDPTHPFPRVGGADLDPLGRGLGGGMLFDPFQTGVPRHMRDPRQRDPNLPPGAIPPFARFDPFGPPGAGVKFHRPDPDHEQKPAGSDDMFM